MNGDITQRLFEEVYKQTDLLRDIRNIVAIATIAIMVGVVVLVLR